MYINKATIYGNLTRDPEVRALPSGQQVATFSVATNRVYRDKDKNRQEASEFHNVVAFGRLAEIIGQYMKKGRPIYIEGRLQTRSWETDGHKNYRTEIVADTFQFGADGSRSDAPGQMAQSAQGAQNSSADKPSSDAIEYPDEDIKPEDIPF